MIGDDSAPTFTFANSSSGDGLYVDGTKGTGYGLNVVGSATNNGARISTIATAGMSIAPLRITASAASQAFMAFAGAFVSQGSINTTSLGQAFTIPVYHAGNNTVGYIVASKGVI